MSEEIKSNEELEHSCDVEEVSKRLGISKTRLSQLTSQGYFSTVRRNIGGRSRVFYHRIEIEEYLKNKQKTAIENLAKLKITEPKIEPSPQAKTENTIEENPKPDTKTKTSFSPFKRPNLTPNQPSSVKKVAESRKQKERDLELKALKEEVEGLKMTLLTQSKQIEALMKLIKNQKASSRLNSSRQRSMAPSKIIMNKKDVNLSYNIETPQKREASTEKRWQRNKK